MIDWNSWFIFFSTKNLQYQHGYELMKGGFDNQLTFSCFQSLCSTHRIHTKKETIMTFLETYLWVLLGVVVSIVLPIAYKATVGKALAGTWFDKVWAFLKPYLPWVVVSVLGALVVTMLTKDIATPQVAFVAGLGWDSFWQRLAQK
jgi:hypothetical protein